MKFLIQFLTLFVLTFSYSLTQTDVKTENNNSRSGVSLPIKKQCNDAIEKQLLQYKDCFDINLGDSNTLNEKQLNEICNKLNNKECEKIDQLKFIEIPECKDSKKESVSLKENLIKLKIKSIYYECLKDENDKYCSLLMEDTKKMETKITNATTSESTILSNVVMNSICKSKKCTTGYLDFYSDMNEISKNIFSKNTNANVEEEITNNNDSLSIFDYLKSDNCTAQQSNAYTINSIFSLYVTFILLLFILFF